MVNLKEDAPVVHPDCHIVDSTFGAYVEIGAGSRIANTRFGDFSYCDRSCDIANVEIGKFSNIASFTRIGATDHPMVRASQHHFLYRSNRYWSDVEDDADWFALRAGRTAFIGHDTWIGHAAIIKPEVTVGHGAVVASGTVVTKDVAPYTIVGGNTAEVIRRRFDHSIADRMMTLAWWDWPSKKIRDLLPDFRTLSAEGFLEKHGS